MLMGENKKQLPSCTLNITKAILNFAERSQPVFICSTSTMKTLDQYVEFV